MGDCGSLWVITFVILYYFVDLFFLLSKIINFLLKCFYEMGIVRDGNCPEWELSGGNCPGWELFAMGTVRDGNCPAGIVRDGNCPVGIVRDGNCPGWELSGMGTVHLVGIVRDGNCPGWELSGYRFTLQMLILGLRFSTTGKVRANPI